MNAVHTTVARTSPLHVCEAGRITHTFHRHRTYARSAVPPRLRRLSAVRSPEPIQIYEDMRPMALMLVALQQEKSPEI